MHLQKCNIKIWNALAKVQSQHSEFTTYPERAQSIEKNADHSRKGPVRSYGRHWLRGSVKFGTLYVPDSHPTPSFVSSGFGVSLLVWSLVGLVVLRLRGARSFCCCKHACNACVTKDGGEARDTPPPLRIITTIVFKLPRILGVGRCPAALPTQCAAEPSTPPHFCPAAVKITARMTEVGERQPYCHTNAVDDRSSSNPVLLFGVLRPYLLAKKSRLPPPLEVPYPVDPRGIRGGTERNALPHTLLIPEGSRGGAESAKRFRNVGGFFVYKRRTECCPFCWRSFLRNANGRRTKCCPFFPFNFPCASVGMGLQ